MPRLNDVDDSVYHMIHFFFKIFSQGGKFKKYIVFNHIANSKLVWFGPL